MMINSRVFGGRPTRVTETQFANESEVENAEVYAVMLGRKVCVRMNIGIYLGWNKDLVL